MKFYSDKLNKLFETEDACVEAENQYEQTIVAKEAKEKQLKETRAERAKEVEDAYKAALEAQNKANELRNAFIKDYGSFHITMRNVFSPLFDFIDLF